jgi:hypothetical protein
MYEYQEKGADHHMINNIGGTSPGGNLYQATGVQSQPAAAQNPNQAQAPAQAGDGIRLGEAAETTQTGAGSPNMDALLNGLNGDNGKAQEAGTGEQASPEKVEAEMQKTKQQLTEKNNEIKKVDSDISNYKSQLSDIDNQIAQAQGDNEKGKNDQKISELNKKKDQINQRIKELENKKKQLEADKKKLEDYLKKLEDTLNQFKGNCNSNRKVEMPQKPQLNDKKDAASWEEKLGQDLEAVRQERGQATPGNQAPNAQGATPALNDLLGNKGDKPAAAAPAGGGEKGAVNPVGEKGAVNPVGEKGAGNAQAANPAGQKGDINNQGDTPAVMTLRNDWEMCKQEGADAQILPETKQEIQGILGIADVNPEGEKGAGQGIAALNNAGNTRPGANKPL